MTDVLVRDVSQEVLESLKERAAQNRRSLQQELLSIIEAAARERARREDHARLAAEIRERLARSGRTFGDSAAEVREDRQR